MFNIMKKSKYCMIASAAVILIGVICFFVNGGFVTDIDFSGGTSLRIDMEREDYDVKEITSVIESFTGQKIYSIQKMGTTTVTTEDTSSTAEPTAAPSATPEGTAEGNAAAAATPETSADPAETEGTGAAEATATPAPTVEPVETVEKTMYPVQIKMPTLDGDQREALFQELKTKFGLQAEKPLASESVTATLSADLLTNALMALVIAIVLILIYISIRFEFASGVAAIVALLHDALIMLAVYAIFRIPVNATFVAAILTIVGYSVNATIIVFDRIRENKKYLKKGSFTEICEKSIWQTMRRTINTTVTTFIALLILFILGAPAIEAFALPLMIGVLVGTYSSIFIASAMWNIVRGSDNKTPAKKPKKA